MRALFACSLLALLSLSVVGCGPDKFQCTGPRESFKILLKPPQGELPEDTVVVVKYGGASVEEYLLAQGDVGHEVLFCYPATAQGVVLMLPDAGASSSAEALSCELWTGGYTELSVRATGILPKEYELRPQDDRCTVSREITLEAGDAGE
jgi:hypothetical protein